MHSIKLLIKGFHIVLYADFIPARSKIMDKLNKMPVGVPVVTEFGLMYIEN